MLYYSVFLPRTVYKCENSHKPIIVVFNRFYNNTLYQLFQTVLRYEMKYFKIKQTFIICLFLLIAHFFHEVESDDCDDYHKVNGGHRDGPSCDLSCSSTCNHVKNSLRPVCSRVQENHGTFVHYCSCCIKNRR